MLKRLVTGVIAIAALTASPAFAFGRHDGTANDLRAVNLCETTEVEFTPEG